MKAKIVEFFSSVQGEGKYVGVRQVFVRFFGCDQNCVWCDTPAARSGNRKSYKEYSITQLKSEVQKRINGCHSVSLTGGEPLLQIDFLRGFLPEIKKKGARIYLETNGIHFKALQKIVKDVDIVSMDMKLPSSTQGKPCWREHKEFLEVASRKDVFVKVVVSQKTSQRDVVTAARMVARFHPDISFILQPNYFDFNEGVIKKCMGLQDICLKHLRDVRIVPQIHKLIHVR
jgi:7-carboxy-7-deazaguanine synthase